MTQMPGARYTHVPTEYDTILRTEDQVNRDLENRRSTLGSVLRFCQQNDIDGLGFVELTEMLGLDAQLRELAGDRGVELERHRRLDDLQLQLGLTVDELEDREV